MKNFQDNFSFFLITFFLIFISCKSSYTDLSKQVTSVFKKYETCNKDNNKIKSDSLFCINIISNEFKILGKYNLKNSVEYLIFKENSSEFLVNSEIHQSILILRNKNQIFNIDGVPMFDNQNELNRLFFETDAFKIRKIEKFNNNFYFVVKEYNAD
jgi:hypothetical protein